MKENELQFICKAFAELSLTELYKILQLRQKVFVVEQNCPYLDADDKDQKAYHLFVSKDTAIVAYIRLLAKGISYPNYASIGRVVNRKSVRGQGIAKKLMQFGIEKSQIFYPNQDIKISAQVYILNFYKNLGFVEIGEEYLEDDIPHKAMILKFE